MKYFIGERQLFITPEAILFLPLSNLEKEVSMELEESEVYLNNSYDKFFDTNLSMNPAIPMTLKLTILLRATELYRDHLEKAGIILERPFSPNEQGRYDLRTQTWLVLTSDHATKPLISWQLIDDVLQVLFVSLENLTPDEPKVPKYFIHVWK